MEVSVVVVAYNEQACIKKCIKGILSQSTGDFELLVVDDCSMDKTAQCVTGIRDKRIQYIRVNENRGIAKARNTGIKHAKGEYIFFTDADCVPDRHWIEEGLRMFKERNSIGVKGRTFYATSKTTISDRITEDLKGRYFSTNNIAYKKNILNKIGGFDEKFKFAFEDEDIGRRAEKCGAVVFSKDMIVIHQRKKYTIKKLFMDAKRAESTVYFIKKHRKHRDYRGCDIICGRILYPKKLLILAFPPLLIFYHSFRSWQDFKLLPFVYANAVYMRIIIWRTAVKEKFFLI